MADVLEFLVFYASRTHRQRRGGAFQCLNARHLIDRDGLGTGLGPFGSQPIGLADIVTFLLKALVVLWRQPTAYTMRLQAGIF